MSSPDPFAAPRRPERSEMVSFCRALADEFEAQSEAALTSNPALFGASAGRMLMLRYVADALKELP